MSRVGVAELLQEIGEILLIPGVVYEAGEPHQIEAPDFRATLDRAIQRLLEAPTEQLDIVYAGLFLHGYSHPTVHLEESVMRYGELRQPATLADLQEVYAIAELEVMAPFESDHLGALASLLGFLLLRMDEGRDKIPTALQEAASRLLREHLQPLQAHVAEQLERVKAHPYYCCVLALLGVVLQIAEQLIPVTSPPNKTVSRCECPP